MSGGVTLSISHSGLATGTSYHWRARTCDQTRRCGPWTPFGTDPAFTVNVSAMGINAVMHLSEVSAPQGVTFLDDLEETIIATITVPTEVEEPEIEEETELVGEEAEEAAEAEAEAGAEGATGDEAAAQGEAAAEGDGEES